MKKQVKAKIFWKKNSQGGRKTIIIGTNLNYCPIIIFDDDIMENTKWSIQITSSKFIKEYETDVVMNYLSQEAPINNLEISKKFKLFEGGKLVATGIIIG